MKIAFFSDTFYPSINGVVTTIVETATFLQEKGHQVLVVVPRSQHVPDTNDLPFQIHYTPSVSGIVYPDFMIGLPDPGLLQLIKNFQPDVIHTHTPFMLGLQGVILGKYLKIPLISTYHTHFSDRESLKTLGLENVPMIDKVLGTVGRLFRFFYNKHDGVISPSHDSARDLANYGVSLPISILPSAVNVERIKAGKNKGLALRKKLHIEQSLIYVGRVSGEKSIDKVIELFARLTKSISNLQLVIVGGGPAELKVREQAEQLGVSSKILMIGTIPHQQVIDEGYYYLGDMFITMSRWETLGLSTLEAMAAGLPVAAVRARANIENVRDIGILIDVEDETLGEKTIIKTLSDSEKMKNFSKLSVAKARTFSPDKIITQLEAIYTTTQHEKRYE